MDKTNDSEKHVTRNTSQKETNTKSVVINTDKLAKMSTSKYTPISKNEDADLSIVDKWCEVRTKSLPTRRSFHCSWNVRDSIYLFGGATNKGKNAEFHRVNLADQTPTWRQILPKNVDLIEPLAYSSGISYEDCLYIICGQNGGLQQVNTIYKLTPTSDDEFETSVNRVNPNSTSEEDHNMCIQTDDILEKVNVENVPYLESHCSAAINEGILIFGGFSQSSYQNKTYFFDVKNNKFIEQHNGEKDCPCPRTSAACTVYLNNLYVYGGQDCDAKYLNDLWVYNYSTNTWEEIIDQENDIWPCGRSGHSMNLYNNEIYIFGGKTNNVMEVNELWKYSIEEKRFILLQESLIEQYFNEDTNNYDNEKLHNNKKSMVGDGKKSNYKHLGSVSGLETMKKKLPKFIVNPEYEKSMYECFPPLHIMTSSLIYDMDTETTNWKKMMKMLTVKSNQNNFVSIMGNIPSPRDGHSCIIYKDYLVIFGGDRNKLPLNDLYTFIF
jgi:hypothetical protein